MPGRLYPPGRIEKKKKKLPFKDHFVSILEENPSRAHTHTHGGGEKARPSLAFGESRATYRSSGRSWQEAILLPVSLCGYSGRPQTLTKNLPAFATQCHCLPRGSATGQPRVTRPRQPRQKHSDPSPTPPTQPPPEVGDLLVVKTQSVDSCLLESPPSQGRVRGGAVG